MIKKTGVSPTRDDAEQMAVDALAFLASEPEELGRFLALAGIGPETLRTAATDPNFLVGVLEYLLENEKVLLRFAARHNIRPTMIAAARFLLDESSAYGDD